MSFKRSCFILNNGFLWYLVKNNDSFCSESNYVNILRIQPTRCDVSQFIYFCKTLYMFQTGFPSIARSIKLHIQRQVFVRPLLLPAASR